MSNLNASEVTEIVNALDMDFEVLRADARNRYDLYALRRDPYVPDEIAREGKLRMLSPLLIHAAQSIRADILMNPTEFTVFPLARERDGSIAQKAEKLAENLERSLAVNWGRLNEGRAIDMDVIWHQLVSPFAVLMLEFQELFIPDQPEWMDDKAYAKLVSDAEHTHLPWHLTVPDPLTCSWVEKDGRPVIFARRYKMLVRDLEAAYSKAPGSVNPDANLVLDGDVLKWVSDDYTRDVSHYKAGFKEVDVMWLDDGENIYHVCQHPGKQVSELLWRGPNPTGRVSAFIVPGNTTPSRKPEDRYEPFLLPLMQSVMQTNNLRSMRATAARNVAGPQRYIAINPEVAKLYIARGEKIPDIKWRHNTMPSVTGDIRSLPSEVPPDWDLVEQGVNAEQQRFLPSPFVHIIDPSVLKAATATSILQAAEAGLRMYGPMMSAYDAVKLDISESMIASIKNGFVDAEIFSHATGEEVVRGLNLERGQVYRMNLQAVDFPHRIHVRTYSRSQAQAAAEYDLALRKWTLPDGSKGPATMDDVITAAGYTDVVAQKMKLAEEAMVENLDPWIQEQAIQAASKEIFYDSGIQLNVGQPIGADGQPTGQPGGGLPRGKTPARVPSTTQHMTSPLVAGPAGGSSGEFLGDQAGA